MRISDIAYVEMQVLEDTIRRYIVVEISGGSDHVSSDDPIGIRYRIASGYRRDMVGGNIARVAANIKICWRVFIVGNCKLHLSSSEREGSMVDIQVRVGILKL